AARGPQHCATLSAACPKPGGAGRWPKSRLLLAGYLVDDTVAWLDGAVTMRGKRGFKSRDGLALKRRPRAAWRQRYLGTSARFPYALHPRSRSPLPPPQRSSVGTTTRSSEGAGDRVGRRNTGLRPIPRPVVLALAPRRD